MKILHVIDTTGPGGAETLFIKLIHKLKSKGIESVAVISGRGWVYDQLKMIDVATHIIYSHSSFDIMLLIALVSLIKKQKIDIIQSHLLGSNVYCSLASILSHTPVVSTFHGYIDIKEEERFNTLKSVIINNFSDKIVFVSKGLKQYYMNKSGFSSDKSIQIYNGIDTLIFKKYSNDEIRRGLKLGQEHILVGSVGNIRKSKGYSDLLKAAKKVVEVNPQYRFIIAGDGGGAMYEDLICQRRRLGLEKHFLLLGYQSDVTKFLNNLDLYVLPSTSEGFSISVIEALACGLPVIATRSGGPEEILNHMENGILVDVGSPSQIASAVLLLNRDKFLNRLLKESGENHVDKFFCITNTIDAYLAEYKLLVK